MIRTFMNRALTGAVFCAVVSFSAFAGGPYYLTADGSSKNNLPFEDPAYWQDEDGGTYAGGGVFDPEGEYFVDNGRVLTAGDGALRGTSSSEVNP